MPISTPGSGKPEDAGNATGDHDQRKGDRQRPDPAAAHLGAPESDRKHGQEMIRPSKGMDEPAAKSGGVGLNDMSRGNVRRQPKADS
jgi:hypothetical protein